MSDAGHPITATDPAAAARAWFAELGRCCAAVDYDSAEAIFAPDVVSFGTKADVVSGLGPLRRNQWEGHLAKHSGLPGRARQLAVRRGRGARLGRRHVDVHRLPRGR